VLAAGRRARGAVIDVTYLAYCAASFLESHISDVQLLLAKPCRLAARPD
jgi:hypothetical protein